MHTSSNLESLARHVRGIQCVPRLVVQAVAVMALFASTAARAQEPAPKEPPPLPGVPGGDPNEKEIAELFGKVELRLREIDSLLFDAGAGKAPKGPVKDAGIDQLLRDAAEQGKAVKTDIDRILEIARKQSSSPPSSGGSKKDEKQKGGSPLDQQRDSSPSGRESTPSQPKDSQEKQGEKQGQDSQPKDSPRRDDPSADPKNRSGGPPPPSNTDRVPAPDSRDKWGDLPVHVREVFRVEGGSDLPPQYRDWIDGYYRRLQQTERR